MLIENETQPKIVIENVCKTTSYLPNSALPNCDVIAAGNGSILASS